jgi:hypothetical protein
MGIQELTRGRSISVALRKLVSYAVWGNAVDAYKFWEYSYQEEYLAHRYLPLHSVLTHLSEPADENEPLPSVFGCSGRHRYVRRRMARANDQGVGGCLVQLFRWGGTTVI